MNRYNAQTMREHAFEQRERLARQIFDIPTVVEKIKQASLGARTDYRIVQDTAADLSITKAAIKLTAWLQKHGYAVAWKLVERPERVKGRPTGLTFKYSELVIDWSGIESLGGFLSNAPKLGFEAIIESRDKNLRETLVNKAGAPNT